MKRRLLAVVAALLSAGVGAALLLGYVSGADRRAMAGMQTQTVLVLTQPVPEGTSADDLAELVETKTLPRVAVAPGAVTDLAELSGRVATAALEPGEQLMAARFADPAALAEADKIQVPRGMHEFTVRLEAQRVLGGQLAAGDTVGVFVSVDRKDNPRTHLVLPQALVTAVVGGLAPAGTQPAAPDKAAPEDADAGETAADPAADLVGSGIVEVRLATTAADAEKVVFGAEHGTLWLSLAKDANSNGIRVVTERSVYE